MRRRWAALPIAAGLVALSSFFLASAAPRLAPLAWSATGPSGAAISVIAHDPSNPSIVWVGMVGGGISRSSGDGSTFSDPSLQGIYVTAIAIRPDAPDTVLLGTASHGLFRTTNGGLDWSLSNKGLPQESRLSVTAIAFDLQEPSTTYVSLVPNSPGTDFFRSNDGGQNWVAATSAQVARGAFPDGQEDLLPDDIGVFAPPIEVRVAPGPSGRSRIYLATEAGFRVSDSDGTHWHLVRDGLLKLQPQAFTSASVDPRDARRVYLGGPHGIFVSRNWGSSFAPGSGASLSGTLIEKLESLAGTTFALAGGRVWRSPTSDEEDWVSITDGFLPRRATALDARPELEPQIAVGLSDGSVVASRDSGGSWTVLGAPRGSPLISALAGDSTNQQVVYAGLARGDPRVGMGVWRSGDGGVTWVHGQNPDLEQSLVRQIEVDPSSTQVVFAAVGDDTLGKSRHGVYKSNNSGGTWTRVFSNAPIVALSVTPTTVYAGAGHGFLSLLGREYYGLYTSTDGGTAWSRAVPDYGSYIRTAGEIALVAPLTSTGTTHLAVLSPRYVGLRDGLYVTADGGQTVAQLPNPLGLESVTPTGLIRTSSRIILATTNGLYASSDAGSSWTVVGTEIPDQGFVALRASPRGQQEMFVLTLEHGVFGSTDGGNSWSSLGPQGVRGTALALSGAASVRVYVGTVGQGVLAADLP